MTPSIFINVFSQQKAILSRNAEGKIVTTYATVDMPHERAVITSRAEAVEDAEEFADDYRYTLTDAGKIDLSGEFSEGFHEQRDFDAAIDRRIDDLKEKRFAGEAA